MGKLNNYKRLAHQLTAHEMDMQMRYGLTTIMSCITHKFKAGFIHPHDCHRTSLKDSAVELSKVYMDDESKPEPQKEERPKDAGGFNPLTYLDMDHPLVEELGFKSIADKAGIGYAGKGMMRSHLAIPIRLPDGRLVGYLGIKGDVKVPLKWKVA